MRGKMNSRRYEVLWESWRDGWRRAGSPVSQWIDFDH